MKLKQHIFLIPVIAAVVSASGCSDNTIQTPLPDASSVITFGLPAVSVEAVGQPGIDKAPGRSTLLNAFPSGESFNVLGYCIPRNVSNTAEEDRSQASQNWKQKAQFSCADVFL